jgi:hypothetical protein
MALTGAQEISSVHNGTLTCVGPIPGTSWTRSIELGANLVRVNRNVLTRLPEGIERGQWGRRLCPNGAGGPYRAIAIVVVMRLTPKLCTT